MANSKSSKRAPGNAKALRNKANDNAAKLNKQRGRAEMITAAVNARTGNGLVVTTSRDRSIVIASVDRQVNALAVTGAPVGPLEAYLKSRPKPEGRLAHGVNPQNAPHSAKAVSDQRSSAKGRKARGDAAAVAGNAKATKKAAGGMRGLAKTPQKMTLVVKPKDSGLAAGSGRMAKLMLAAKCKTTADFLGKTVTDDSGKVHKCDAGALSGMVKRGHVRLG